MSFISLIFLIIFPLYISVDPNFIRINDTLEGEILEKGSYAYYSTSIPTDIGPNTFFLIIQVTSIHSETSYNEPIFVISKSEKFPTFTNSDYQSLNGNGIITIPSNEVSSFKHFYIGVYCEDKCKFKIKVHLARILYNIKEEKYYNLNLKPNENLVYVFHNNKKDFDQIKFLFNSNDIKKNYKVYISRDLEISKNSIEIFSVWGSGKTGIITKNDKNLYCNDCDYYILINNKEENEKINLFFYITYPLKEIDISHGGIIQETIKKNGEQCYTVLLKKKYDFDNLLINLVIYGGSAYLKLNGFSNKTDINYETIFYDNMTLEIYSQDYINIGKNLLEDFKYRIKFENNTYDRNGNKIFSNESIFHFCVFSLETISYTIQSYFDYEIELKQKNNILFAGNNIKNILPKKMVTSYKIMDYSNNNNLTIILDNIKGNLKFYAFFSPKNTEIFNENNLENYSLIPSIKQEYGEFIKINNKDNYCHNLKDDDDSKNSCSLLTILFCQDEQQSCSYELRFNHDNSSTYMELNKTYYNNIQKGENNYYNIIIKDEKIIQLNVVLFTINGNADLNIYYVEKNNQLIDLDRSSNEEEQTDKLVITPYKINKKNLKGEYLIKIQTDKYSSYNLSYYVNFDETNKKKNSTNYFLIFFLLIILTIIIIFAYYWFKRYNKTKDFIRFTTEEYGNDLNIRDSNLEMQNKKINILEKKKYTSLDEEELDK